MSARNYVATMGVGQSIRLPGGRFFYIRTAAGPLDVSAEGIAATPIAFTGLGAGTVYGPVPPESRWTYLIVTSASAQNIEIIISDDSYFNVANAVTVTGAVTTTQAPNTGITPSAADVVVGTGAGSNIAANLSRKSIMIAALNANSGILRVQSAAAGANLGVELSPGEKISFSNTAAITVRNDTGANQSYNVLEET